MSFELWGFNGQPFLSLPAGLHGAVIMAVYAAVALALFVRHLRDLLRLNQRQWLLAAGLLGAAFIFAQLFIIRIPANILPPPGLLADPQRPGLPLFALAPAFLAGGWLGVAPAMVAGFLTGLSRAGWETYSLATPIEYALAAGALAWAVRQDYKGIPASILRRPVLAGLIGALALGLLQFFSYLAYSPAIDLNSLDYVISLTVAAIPVFGFQIVLAGLVTELAAVGLPAWWP